MGKNRRGRRGKKSNQPQGPVTSEVCSSAGDHYHSDDHDETDIACYVFTDDGFYTTKDPAVIAQNNRDMEQPAPPIYIKIKGKKWRDLHQELRFKAMFEFSAKCLDEGTLLELQLANMYDYKAVKPKIAKYIVPAPGDTIEKKKWMGKKETTQKIEKTEEAEKTEEENSEDTTVVKKKKSKPVKALLRGLPWLCDEEGVRDGLLYEGFGDVAVKLHNRTNRKKPPLFKLAVDTGEDPRRRKDAHKVFELTKLLGFQVTVEPLPEEYDSKPQCYKCQQEGHVAKYCRNRAICVKCAGYHDSRDCPLKKEDQPTCARCGAAHVASYRGCKAFSGDVQATVQEESSDEADSSEEEFTVQVNYGEKNAISQTHCSEMLNGNTIEHVICACDAIAKKKRRRRKLLKPPSVLAAQKEPAEQPNSIVEKQEGSAAKAECVEEDQHETTEQANGIEKPQEETAEQENSDSAAGTKRRRRKKKRGKTASAVPAQDEGEGEPATATSPPPRDQPEDPTGGGGGEHLPREQVAAEPKDGDKVSVKGMEGELAAVVSKLVTEHLSATVLETVQAVLKAAK